MTVYTAKYPQNGGATVAAFSALDTVPYPIFVLERNRSIAFSNQAAKKFFDIPSLDKNADINTVLKNCSFVSFEHVEKQLANVSRSVGIHVVLQGSKRVCYRLTINPLGTGDTVISFEPIQLERDHQQLKLLLKIADLGASRLSVEALCKQIIEATFEHLRVDIAVIALIERDQLKPIAWRGLMIDPEFGTTGIVTHEVERALETNQPMSTDGGEWGEGLGDGLTGTHFVVPLVINEKPAGTLHLGALSSVRLFSFDELDADTTDPASALDDMDRLFLSTLAEQIASAIDNSNCYERYQASRTQLTAVVNAIQEGVMVFDADGTILVANPESRRISEIDWVNLNARRPYRVCSADGRPLPRPEWPFFRAVSDGIPVSDEHLIFDFGDRKKHVIVDVVGVEQSTLVGTVRDITAQRDRAQQYEDFLSAIGHELRSPLTPLLGMLQLIHSRLEKGAEIDISLVNRSEKQVKRLSRLIDALLDVTRIETGRIALHKERCNLSALIEGFMENWQLQFPNHVIETDIDHGTVAHVDPGRIEQVLTNLVENAAKHSEMGSTIVVRVNKSPLEISVVDNGTGMDAATAEQAFDRFFQGGPINNQGIGLGLYISREIVDAHGGTIRVESEPGQGAIVTISIPEQ